MLENVEFTAPGCDDENSNATAEYLKRAAAASEAGDAVLSMHLYLAAFEQAAALSDIPSEDALRGLKQAWALACANKERSLAEYIYEKMEPYLTQDEVAACMSQLQALALDRLEEFGVSREELEEMTQMISRDIMGLAPDAGMPLGVTPKIVKVEHVMDHRLPLPSRRADASAAPAAVPGAESGSDQAEGGASSPKADAAPAPSVSFATSAQAAAAQLAASAGQPAQDGGEQGAASDGSAQSAAGGSAEAQSGQAGQPGQPASGSDQPPFEISEETAQALAASAEGALRFLSGAGEEQAAPEEPEVLNYGNLAGYGSTIAVMHEMGIGLQGDAEFGELVRLLNARHGLDRMPPLDTLLFRSPAREDANRFIAATVGEIKRPALRMHMEENLQGVPMLCVTAQADISLKSAASLRNVFADGGILVLEDLDLWNAPALDAEDERNPMSASVARGAREAVNLIRSAVENPDVFVLASASGEGLVDDFFLDLLEPVTLIDIDCPTPEERVEIWMDIAREHPSVRGVNRADLVRLSANMPRYDIYLAAREAIEESYKLGVLTRRYQAVTRDNLFDKLAAYQPLESNEYHELEEAVVRDFRRDFDQFESYILGGQG